MSGDVVQDVQPAVTLAINPHALYGMLDSPAD